AYLRVVLFLLSGAYYLLLFFSLWLYLAALLLFLFFGASLRSLENQRPGLSSDERFIGCSFCSLWRSGRELFSKEKVLMEVSLDVQKPQSVIPTMYYDVIVVGAGPYGLSAAAHLQGRGLKVAIFGKPLHFWREYMPQG